MRLVGRWGFESPFLDSIFWSLRILRTLILPILHILNSYLKKESRAPHKPLCVNIESEYLSNYPFVQGKEIIMTVQEFQARKTERIAIAVAHYVATTPADNLDWCPATGEESCTRSVLD